jgi:hypothetical protein
MQGKLDLRRRETVPGGQGAQFRWWCRNEDAAREFEKVILKMNKPALHRSLDRNRLTEARRGGFLKCQVPYALSRALTNHRELRKMRVVSSIGAINPKPGSSKGRKTMKKEIRFLLFLGALSVSAAAQADTGVRMNLVDLNGVGEGDWPSHNQ